MPQSRTLLVAAFSLLTLCTGCLAEPEWETFSSEEGRFEVEMRGTPEYEARQVPAGGESLTMHNYFLETKNGHQVFFVMYVDYPSIILLPGPDAVLDGACDGALQNAGMSQSSVRELEVEAGAGREIQASGSRDGIEMALKSRMFLSGTRLYQVMVVSTESLSDSPDIDHYLDSFHMLPAAQPSEEQADEPADEPAEEAVAP